MASFEEVRAFVTSPEAQRQLGKQLADTLAAQVDQINIALDQGGDANAEELGKKMGQTYALVIGTVASGGGGSASKSLTLAKMGIERKSSETRNPAPAGLFIAGVSLPWQPGAAASISTCRLRVDSDS